MKTRSLFAVSIVIAFGGLLFVFPTCQAAVFTKADNSDALNLASSWTNNLIPANTDSVLFNSTITTPTTAALGTNTSWDRITFMNPGGDVTITGGDTLTLYNDTPITFSNGSANLTINCDLVCAGAILRALPSASFGRTVTYAGSIRGRSFPINLGNSTGTIRLGSSLSTFIGSSVQVATPGVKVGIGASSVGNPVVSGPLGTNLLAWGTTSASTELFTYDGNQALGNPVAVFASPLNFNSAYDLTFSGVVDMTGGNRILNVASNGVLRLTGTVINATGITKTGGGLLELGSRTNLSIGNSSSLSIFGGTVRLMTNQPTQVSGALSMTNTSAKLDLNGFNASYYTVTGSGFGLLRDWNGTVDNAAANTTAVLFLGITGWGGTTADYTCNMTGTIQNSGPGAKLILVNRGGLRLVIYGTQTFSGGITNHGILYLNGARAAGTGPITLVDSELGYSGGGSVTWTNEIILEPNTKSYINANTGNAAEVAGVIRGSGQLYRYGQSGMVTFSRDNTYTGGFVLANGPVTLKHPRAIGLGTFTIGDVMVAGNSSPYIVPGVNLSSANAITNSIFINSDFTIAGTNAIEFAGSVLWTTNALLRLITVTNPAGIFISGPMTGYGFNKAGIGRLTVNGVCSHDGPSSISGGTLAVGPNGNFTGNTTFLIGSNCFLDVSSAPSFAIKPNQSLQVGNGAKVSGDVTINGNLTNSAQYAPAIFSNALVLAVGSTSVFTINRHNQSVANLTCLGSLAFGGHLIVTNSSDALLAGDTFRLFSFAGNPGTFSNLTLPALDPSLAWNTNNLSLDGSISVVSTAPRLSNPSLLTPTDLVFTVTGGTTNGQFRVLTQTNVDEAIADWIALSTNTYGPNGSLTLTNQVNPAELKRFFRIVQP